MNTNAYLSESFDHGQLNLRAHLIHRKPRTTAQITNYELAEITQMPSMTSKRREYVCLDCFAGLSIKKRPETLAFVL